jgi:hypothetical protein
MSILSVVFNIVTGCLESINFGVVEPLKYHRGIHFTRKQKHKSPPPLPRTTDEVKVKKVKLSL